MKSQKKGNYFSIMWSLYGTRLILYFQYRAALSGSTIPISCWTDKDLDTYLQKTRAPLGWIPAASVHFLQTALAPSSIKYHVLNTYIHILNASSKYQTSSVELCQISTAACWEAKFPQHTAAYQPDVQPWQHGGCTSTNNPHSEKHDEQSCWEHHLVGVGSSISYSQSKCHGSPETYQKEWNNTALEVQPWLWIAQHLPCSLPQSVRQKELGSSRSN